MIKLEVIKHQMDEMEMSSYYLWKLTGVGYATINGLLNGDRKLETSQVKNYEAIVNALFTPTERSFAEKSYSIEEYETYYKLALSQALDSKDIKINLSGGVDYNENNEPMSVPAHIKINWGFIDPSDQLYSMRVFDKGLYKKILNKGQKDKLEILKGVKK